MNAHFFDLNSLITMNSKVWIVNTRTPNKPLIRISKSEFNLLRKGVYKKDNINFNIDGQTYWLSEELFNKIKIKSKNNNVNISELSFSMQEFMNKDIVDNNDLKPVPIGQGLLDYKHLFDVINKYRPGIEVIIEDIRGDDLRESQMFLKKFC